MQLASIAETLRILGDETRLRVLHLLFVHQDSGLLAGEIVETLGLPQPTVSRHLSVLKEAGLVEVQALGTCRRYGLCRVQPRLHRALLSALEEFVNDSPVAREDLILSADKKTLRAPNPHATNRLHVDDDPGERSMTAVLSALSHPLRRQMVDIIVASPGCAVGNLSDRFDVSRAAVGKHLSVLERAGIVISRRSGRHRRLYHNAVPLQLAYDRWTDRFTAPLAQHMASIKYAVEDGA